MQNKKILILLTVIFVLPIVLAKLALEFDFFNRGAMNKGELISPPLSLETIELPEKFQRKWLLIYPQMGECTARCENAKYAIKQVHQALGKEMDRVEPIMLTQSLPENSENINLLNVSEEIINQVFNGYAIDAIFLADPLGNIMLKFELTDDKQAMVMRSREILSDLKKLLKLSKIG